MGNEQDLHAILVGIDPSGEADALVRFFCQSDGAVTAKARSLRKPQSKLSPQLKPANELSIRLAGGRGSTPVLTGVTCKADHQAWRDEINLTALYWFFAECVYVGSSIPELNTQVFQLTVNLLRNPPGAETSRYGALAVFTLKFLNLHGLLPDLGICVVDGHRLGDSETVHLLPSYEGLIGLEAYNRSYARTGGGLVRIGGSQLSAWRRLLQGRLLEYSGPVLDRLDASLMVEMMARLLGNEADRNLKTTTFLRSQWKLDDRRAILDMQRS